MTLMRVRLELARNPEYPEGNPNDAYEFTVPLAADGRIDLGRWDEAAQYCTLRRYEPDGTVLTGQLIRTARGEWAFSYQPGDEDDESVYRFASHAFRPGEYLTITQEDESDHVYRVVSVRNAAVSGA